MSGKWMSEGVGGGRVRQYVLLSKQALQTMPL